MCVVQIRQNFCFLSQKERWTCIRRENKLLLGKYPMIFFDCCHLVPTKSSTYCADQAAGSFFVIISIKKTVFLRKTKTVPMQYHPSEILLLIHLHFKLELNQYIDRGNSWSSLFMLEAEEISQNSDTECCFSLSFAGSHWIVQY